MYLCIDTLYMEYFCLVLFVCFFTLQKLMGSIVKQKPDIGRDILYLFSLKSRTMDLQCRLPISKMPKLLSIHEQNTNNLYKGHEDVII